MVLPNPMIRPSTATSAPNRKALPSAMVNASVTASRIVLWALSARFDSGRGLRSRAGFDATGGYDRCRRRIVALNWYSSALLKLGFRVFGNRTAGSNVRVFASVLKIPCTWLPMRPMKSPFRT